MESTAGCSSGAHVGKGGVSQGARQLLPDQPNLRRTLSVSLTSSPTWASLFFFSSSLRLLHFTDGAIGMLTQSFNKH